MKNPLILSLVQLTRPDGRTLVVAAVLWSLVGFIALWSGVTWSINYFDPFSSSWSSVLFGWLSSIISLVFTILLFPALMFMAIGLFQERAAGIVEAAHYPNLDSPRQSSIVEQARLGVRFLVWTILVNGLAFPLYFLPFANVFILLFVNGFVIGREYFEVAAIRRMSADSVRKLRRTHRVKIWMTGVTIAVLFWIPFVNLVAPLIGVMVMTHLFHRYRMSDVD